MFVGGQRLCHYFAPQQVQKMRKSGQIYITPVYTSEKRYPFKPGLVLLSIVFTASLSVTVSSLHFHVCFLSSDFTFAYSFVIQFHFHLLCLFCLFCRFCLSCDACLSCEKSITICHSLTHSLTNLTKQACPSLGLTRETLW